MRPFLYSATATKSHLDRKAPKQDDSDDFIVPDDTEDSDVLSASSKDHKRSASRSSMHSTSSKGGSAISELDDDDDLDDVPKTVPKKSKHSGGNAKTFLTAAEERTLNKKTEKKTEEKPFDFLKDVKDKDGVKPGQPGYDPRTIFIPKSSWNEFTPFEKQVRRNPQTFTCSFDN